jgi:hypothetical protein
MATRLYFTNLAANATPTANRGAWDQTAGAVTMAWDTTKSGALTSIEIAETSATANFDVLLGRFVSGPLVGATISGTINGVIGLFENNAALDATLHLHIYVMDNTGAVRGTLLTDYVELIAREWSTTATSSGRALAASQTLTSVTASSGDRIVCEIGYQAANTITTSMAGRLYYGGTGSDLVATNDNATVLSGWLSLSATLAFQTTLQMSQEAAEAAIKLTAAPALHLSQQAVETVIKRTAAPTVDLSQLAVEVATKAVTARPRSQIQIVG